MSKMDRILNSKKDTQTIYEIYRACRLCGAGAGYKMPIIQNVVDSDDSDVELKQKVRECVQIEVHQDDKMPPLICELCVDKVNDFYEFLEMCRETNKRTRLRLGLPPQSMPRGAPDAGECILGLTEPVYVEDSDGEPLAKHKKLPSKVKVKKEPELKLEKKILTPIRPSRFKGRRSPTPPRITRHRLNPKEDNISLSRLQTEDSSLLTPRLKRPRDKEPSKSEPPSKKVKIAVKSSSHTQKSSPHTQKSSQPTPKLSPKTPPRTVKLSKTPKITPKRPVSPPPAYKCGVCGQAFKTPQANMSHMRIHGVSFTSPRLACNPCGLWFRSHEETTSHHKYHKSKSKPYTCRRCDADFKHLTAYDDHFGNNQCIPWDEVPDVKCEVCWHMFATYTLLNDHRCMGEDHRPGGKCSKCKRSYALLRNLKKHEQTCTARKKGELIVDPVLLGKLKPIQVRMSRCDSLLENVKQEHYDVSSVTADFGLDKNCVYPYISSVSSLRIKSEFDGMVAIKDEIKEEFCTEEDYVHWDSEDSESDEEVSCNQVLSPFAKKKNVDTLANLTIKTLFSRRCLGKVPKKRRRVKQEKNLFDSLLANETEDDVTRDINNIIDNLGDDDELGDGEGVNDKIDGVNNVTEGMDVSDDKISDVGGKDDVVDGKDDIVDGNDVVDKAADVTNDKGPQLNDVDMEDAANDVRLADDNVSTDKNAQNDVKFSENVDNSETIEKNDVVDKNNQMDDDQVILYDEQDVNSVTNDGNSVCNDSTGANNNLSSNSNDDLMRIDKLNNISDGSCKNDDSKVNDNSEVSKDENQNDGDDLNNDFSAKNDGDDLSSKVDETSQDSCSVLTLNENLLNDSTQSDIISENEKESIDKINIDVSDNATSLPDQNSEIDENKSQEEFSLENLNQDSKTESDINHLESKTDKNEVKDKNEITDNDYKNAISVIVNSGKKNLTDSDEMDDSKLMEALDAQIGEGNGNEQVNSFNDKIALDDLLNSKADVDVIPEFNFDA